MSFAKEAKLEILRHPPKKIKQCIAFLSGLFRVLGEWNTSTQTLSIKTDIKELFDFCQTIINKLFPASNKLEIESDFAINKKVYYRIVFPKNLSRNILETCEILRNNKINFDEISYEFLTTNSQRKAFIKGVFIGSATSGIRLSTAEDEKTFTGCDIDFVSHSQVFLKSFSKFLAGFGIFPKMTKRKSSFVLYIRETSQVCDLLAIIGAFESVIKLQDELVLRELRNKINRQTNCLNANITKTVEASLKQVKAIQKIISSIGLEALPPDLQEVALLRLANREESLGELLLLSNTPITKSVLNHKLNKLIKISKEVRS